uniref:NADH dehydrogenase [ubiquinone] flavoprotein 2, mitochondrial n=1 Tax=Pseudo-nitzschia delicatissima TaxID=44447 RepID=A0A7S0Y909_9STRA|mmetsp:Transcript_887/g.1817  ORF Transcript_887/g.1817 Transcript_887/m.1817 type:complete len:263 (+) Transcript_887:69-857(+)
MLSTRSTQVAKSVANRLLNKQSVRSMGTTKSFHLESDKNNETTQFDFTDENYERANRILSKYPDNYRQAAMIPLLDLAQRQNGGWLPLVAMDKVAQLCHVAPVRVYEVASFYTMFNRTPVGKYFMQVCGTTPCMICGSEEIMKTIQDHLGIKNGQTTEDGYFTLLEVECLGACANAPMVQINDDYYECLSKETMIELLEAMKKDQLPPVGKWGSLPMNGQVSTEGPLGKTSLFTVPKPPAVDPDRFKDGNVNPADVKKHMAY